MRHLLSFLLLVSCTRDPVRSTAFDRAPLLTATPAMTEARGRFACAPIGGDKVLAIASDVPGGIYSSTAEIYDATSDTWTKTGVLTNGRWEHAATVLGDGRVLVAGGYEDDKGLLSSVELYDPKTGSWTTKASLGLARRRLALVTLPSGAVVALGGAPVETTAERYDPKTDTWTMLPPMNGHHDAAVAAALPDGRVIVAGGPTGAPEVLDAAATKFTEVPFVVARDTPTLTTLPDGGVLATGGSASDVAVSTAEVFDPKTDTWSAVSPMTVARAQHAAVVTPAGVLVAGGASDAVDLYDPAAKRFVRIGHLALAREALCAAPLGDGALFLGGARPGSFNTYTELVDRWRPSPNGLPCTVAAECASRVCSGGTCAAVVDAGLPTSDAPFSPPTASDAAVSAATFQRCARDAECASGHCVEGVCCDTGCNETCHSCALPGSPGRCTAEPVGVDVKGECGAALSCTGTCGPAQTCIGSGPGAQCARSRCTSANAGVGPAVCASHGGACPTDSAVPFSCGAYACEPAFGACLTGCTATTDCAGGFVCDVTSHTCTAPAASSDSGGCGTTRSPTRTEGLPFLTAALAALYLGRRRRA